MQVISLSNIFFFQLPIIYTTYKSYLPLQTLNIFAYFVLITFFKIIFSFISSFIQFKKKRKEKIQIINQVKGRRIDFLDSLVFPAMRVLGLPQRNPENTEKYPYRHGTVNGLWFVYELRKMLSKLYTGNHACSFYFAVDLLTYRDIRSFSGTVTNIRQQRRLKKNYWRKRCILAR